MLSFFSRAAFASTLTLALASPVVAAPMNGSFAFSGSWKCTSTATPKTYTETWASPVPSWDIATDNAGRSVFAQHAVHAAGKMVTVSDVYASGNNDVFSGEWTSATAALLHSVYPAAMHMTLKFRRTSRSIYTVDVNGTLNGKRFSEHDVCRR